MDEKWSRKNQPRYIMESQFNKIQAANIKVI